MSSPTLTEGYPATDHSGSGAKSASVALPSGATILIVSAARNDDAAGPISGVTYGGVALTQIPDSPQVYGASGIGKCALSVWELDDLTAVSGTTLAWTQSGPTTIQATFITSPAVRTDTAGNLWSQTGGDRTVNVVPSFEGVAVVACGQHDGFSNPIITPYGSQTQLSEDQIDNVQLNVSYLSGITSTQAVGGSFSGSLGSTFQPRVIAALYESADPIQQPVVAGAEAGIPDTFVVSAGPPNQRSFAVGGSEAGIPPGFRVSAQGPAEFALIVMGKDRPQHTEGLRGDGSPAQEGDMPVYHLHRPPTLEEPPSGGASDHGDLTGVTSDQHHARQHSITSGSDHTFPGGSTFLRADGTFASAGSSLTVEEDGGSPITDVDHVVFEGAEVTDDGGGQVTVLGVGTAGFAKETIGRTTIGASFESSTARICYKQVTITKPGLITSIAAHVKGNGTNVGPFGVALFSDNAGVPGPLLAVGAHDPYSPDGTLSVFKSTTAAWLSRPLNAWVEAGTYWLAVLVGSAAAPAALQIAYDGTGDYHLAYSSPNQWFTDPALSAPSAASRSYSIKADIIYGGQGERGYREATSFPTGAPAGTKVYRTDIEGGMLFRYDGTQWVSDQLFVESIPHGAHATPITATTSYRAAFGTWGGTMGIYFVRLDFSCYVETTNNGSNYWSASARTLTGAGTGTNRLTSSTAAGGAAAYDTITDATGVAVSSANCESGEVTITKVGSPGGLYGTVRVAYRLIAT